MSGGEILFVSGDVGGNVPPTMALAGELARRGHHVSVAGLGPRSGDRWPADIVSIRLPALDGMDVTRKPGVLGHMPALARMALGRAVARQVRELLSRRRPEVVIVDGVMLAAIREAVRTGIPTAVLFHSFGAFWNRGMSGRAVNALLRPFGLAPLRLLERTGALLLPTDRELDPAGGGASQIPFEWLGTTERAVPPSPHAADTPDRVLVSLSTAWQRRQGDVYRRVIEALTQLAERGIAVHGIVTTGGAEVDGALEPTPAVEIRGRAPHDVIMPHAALVVGHGGHSTTLRALAHGVPLLIIPLDPTSDQRLIGGAVERAGLGRMLSRRASSTEIRDAILSIVGDSEIRTAARRTGERLRRQDGARIGADRIEALRFRRMIGS